ncbi:lipopolysaccharide biosynthesis protein [Vagococcus luciliae]|uniref:Polysaccharide biosynthesis protein C-terminal domain-containing protein n=1 Tax=Vagococcus luciliae TaxID=2920380 RepID=A0ABY5P247_9ENTE|nr:oligosaccharide flippase family protein [Vagococcus luciliae]UUV99894.1 hypothetical protein G314FT_20630 [Vagococcus luciliae]
MNKYKKLISNSLIFAIGNLGSKLIVILLVPLYTYYLTPAEYGVSDLIMTTTSLLLPIVSMSIFDGVLRFVMDKNDNKEVFYSGFIITIFGNIIILLIFILNSIFNWYSDLKIFNYILILLSLQSFQSLLNQYVRAVERIKLFAINGILTTIILMSFNIILIVKYNMGIEGYIYSQIMSLFVSNIFLMYMVKIKNLIYKVSFNKELTKNMLLYSLPLIPNALMWWIINSSNRYVILLFLGASANGLFAVASKVPSVISIFQSIFFQSWQLSAIEEYESDDKGDFYSKTFNYFSLFMIFITYFIIVFVKLLFKLVISPDYFVTWKLVPFLTLGVMYSSFSAFLGTNYIASKETKGILKTTIIGGFLNIVISIILVQIIGLQGVGIATSISFFIVFIVRYYDTQKYIQMRIDWKKFIFLNLILIIQSLVLFQIKGIGVLAISIILFTILVFICKKDIYSVVFWRKNK